MEAPPDVDLHGNKIIRQSGNVTVMWDIYIGFILDGVMQYNNLSNSTDRNLRQKGLVRILPAPTFPSSHEGNKKVWYEDGVDIWFTVGAVQWGKPARFDDTSY